MDFDKINNLEKQIQNLQLEIKDLKGQLANQKKDHASEVRQAYADVEEYFYTVSHELIAPVREIDLYAKFIEEDSADMLMPESASDLHSIRQTCEKLVEMIRGFIEYSKADKKILNRDIIKTEPLIRNVFLHVTKAFPDRRIDLEISELPDIIGDIVLIQQMVQNILSNCVKFTQNIANAKIKVYSYEELDQINICFEDNGTGLDMRYASDVFGIFERVYNENEFDGYGIGLATVKRIVERFDGNVEIFGIINKGCTVTVKFPKSMVISTNNTLEINKKKKDKIFIGIICIQSGNYSVITPSRKYAYELAAEEINAHGGIGGKKIELLFKDCQSDVALAAQQAWELLEIDQVDAIMGGVLSSVREEIRKVVDKIKVPYFFNSLYEGGVADHYTFFTSVAPEHNLYPMLQYLLGKYGKKCYIITADYNYGILSAESFQVSKSNFDVTIENIKEAMPDILLSFLVSKNQNNFYKQWHEKGYGHIPIISTIGIGLSFLHKIYEPPAMNNIYFMSSYIEELETSAAREFQRKMREKYPKSIAPYIEFDAESAYTAIYLYKNAVEIAGTTETENVIKALESGKVSFDGPGGKVTVRGEDHNVIRDLNLFRVNENNEIEEICQFPGLYSNFIENVIEQETGIMGGLRKCGLKSPNIQYNLMFHKIL